MARFGSQVTVLDVADHILPLEEPDAARSVARSLERDGIRILTSAKVLQAGRRGADRVLLCEHAGTKLEIVADAILVAVGRAPNVEGLDLEKAGVRHGKLGIEVDDRLRSSNPDIYAAGDVASRYKFTHAADAMARIVINNALFFGRKKASRLVIPWVTYTDPEVAHVGLYEHEAKERGLECTAHTLQLASVDRAVLDGDHEGYARLLVGARGRILGATIVARNAGDMIGELSLAMSEGLKAAALSAAIHPYPTQAEVLRKLGDSVMRARLTPRVKRLFEAFLNWRRS
jgi:pyruvate/2-oxoglutarate dehydrogenase complex dihydrolipoamide dehydrogenase (E3) component